MNHLIMKRPVMEGNNYFTHSVVLFLLLLLALAVSVLICFWGYKYFQTLMVIVLSCFSGYAGLLLTEHLTGNPIIKMFFFVIFTFFGSCFFYAISVLFDKFLKMIHLQKKIMKNMYFISSVLGAALTAVIIYGNIYDSWIINLLIFGALSVTGSLYQKRKKAEQPEFHCYEDIYKMKPLPEGEEQNA